MKNFAVFFVVSHNKLLNKQVSCCWLEMPWYSCSIILMSAILVTNYGYNTSWYSRAITTMSAIMDETHLWTINCSMVSDIRLNNNTIKRHINFLVLNFIKYIYFLHNIIFSSSTVLYLPNWGQVTHICVSNLTIIGLDNGLSLGQCQAIIWINTGKFQSKLIHFLSRKCTWKCCLEKGSHLVSASMC